MFDHSSLPERGAGFLVHIALGSACVGGGYIKIHICYLFTWVAGLSIWGVKLWISGNVRELIH